MAQQFKGQIQIALVLASLAVCFFSSASLAQQPMELGNIIITGNDVTQEKYILRWAGLAEGQQVTQNELEAARQRIQNTGLFKRVAMTSQPSLDSQTTELTIELEEKIYTLVIPRLGRNGDGDVKSGIRLQMENLNGANQRLRLTVETEDEVNGDQSDVFRISYNLPLFNNPYELGWSVKTSEESTSRDDFDNIEYQQFFSMEVSRDYLLPDYERDLEVTVALALEDRSLEQAFPQNIEAPDEGYFNRLGITLEYDRVDKHQYRRSGHIYELSYAQGFDWLGSDYFSKLLTLEMRGYRPMNRWDNINYRLELGNAWDSPFDYPRFGLGGSSTLRGLESFDERGDSRFFSNIEYVFGFARFPTFRTSVFIDAGNVYDDFNSIVLTDLRYTLGVGMRWKLQSFVKTDLFLDYGYDIDTEESKLYGGTSLAF